MGLLVDGVWQDRWYDTSASGGRFVRSGSQFRNWVTRDGAPGPTGSGGFKAEPGRYHLYVAYACPWAHRTLIYRTLKGLQDAITVSFVHWFMGDRGWTFQPDDEGVVADRLYGSEYLYQIYLRANATYSGRVTVPVLWDRKTEQIVSNESSEIIRMFNSAFDAIGATPGDTYPQAERNQIDGLNQRIYDTVNNGVYKSGFATNQAAYEEAVGPLFDTLDMLNDRLSTRRFLLGAAPLEAEWRLFPTLVRFDAIYAGHFKCNLRRLVDYPHLWGYARDLYHWPGIADTINFTHNKKHYYQSHQSVNPHRIVPIGPRIDWCEPHDRARLAATDGARPAQ